MKVKISLTQFARLQTIILSCLIILIMIFFGLFLYKNFYKTLADAGRLSTIREQVSTERINISLFNQVTKNIENKKAAPEVNWATFKNPFLPYESETNSNEQH